MKALLFPEKDQPLVYQDVPDPIAEEGQAVVELKAAALNRRDVFITQGLYPGIVTPIILGSDGAGVVDGREVIINPNIGWGDNPNFPDKAYTILGMPVNGTLAEKVVVGTDRLVDKPAHLSWAEAASLPLGGLTAYRSVFSKGQLTAGQKVLVTGVGGGVALIAFQLALAAGAEVYVTSGSPEKLAKATEMGAKGAVNYKEEDWAKQLKGLARGFDLIIDSAGGDGFSNFVNIINPGGRIVTYGGTRGKINGLSPQRLFWKQATIMGTSMGTDQEFQDLVAFVGQHKIKPVVDSVFPLAEAHKALNRMEEGLQFGKIIIDIAI